MGVFFSIGGWIVKHKVCTKCKIIKPILNFNKKYNKFAAHCKECKIIYRKNNYVNIKNQQDLWRINNREYDLKCKKENYNLLIKRNTDLKKKFQISNEEYDNILKKQNFVCAICKKPESAKSNNGTKIKYLAVDHDHKTNKVRGLLCMFCNTGLGKFKDNIELLNAAIDYIKNNKEN